MCTGANSPPVKPWALAVKAVIQRDDRAILLLRRSAANRNFVGCWEWPGGKPDPGESFAEALVREVREECGLEIDPTAPAGVSSFEMASARVVLLCMHARILGGEVRLSHEHDAHVWLSLEEHARRDVVAPMRPILAGPLPAPAGNHHQDTMKGRLR